MNPLGVVKNEIVHQKAIEFFRIKQKVGMIIDKLLLERSIESLNVSIHLGSLRVGMVVNEMKLFQSSGKMFLEFRTIVGQNVLDWMGKDFETQIEEFLGCFGSVRRGGPSKTKTSVNVFEGNDISSNSIHKTLNGIEGDQMTGILCFEILWFPDDFLTINFSLSAKVREFLGIQSQATQVFD